MVLMRTLATPDMPMLRAAAFDRSMILPFHEGTAVIDRNRYGAAIAQILGVNASDRITPDDQDSRIDAGVADVERGPTRIL
jgi:hypothetical protein